VVDVSSALDVPHLRLGLGICYDVRFPEYAALLVRRGASVLIYPGAFNTTTGPAHWELLARARAVDGQAFVALCSPAKVDDGSGGYVAHGHSLVSDPWGRVLVDAGEGAGIVYADLALGEVGERRAAMPFAGQRRGDVYRLVDVKQETGGGV
jgi:omega-amidase